jgi:hypothetical protein
LPFAIVGPLFTRPLRLVDAMRPGECDRKKWQ